MAKANDIRGEVYLHSSLYTGFFLEMWFWGGGGVIAFVRRENVKNIIIWGGEAPKSPEKITVELKLSVDT